MANSDEKVLEIMKETGAFLEGHFLLSSGRHSDKYCQCAKLLQYPDKAAEALSVVVEKLKDLDIDLVVGPAMGGIVAAYEVARQLGKPAIFTEREDGEMTLRRGFEIKDGQKIIIMEDVVTTGKSTKETKKVLEGFGGEVLGVACIVNRTKEDIGMPIYSCIDLDIPNYEKEECPLCAAGDTNVVKPGSRKIKA